MAEYPAFLWLSIFKEVVYIAKKEYIIIVYNADFL